MSEFNANNVDPDQILRSEASDLGLRCLQISLLWNARLKWVNLWGHVVLQASRISMYMLEYAMFLFLLFFIEGKGRRHLDKSDRK